MRFSASRALQLRKAIGLAVMEKVETGRLPVSAQRGFGVWKAATGKRVSPTDVAVEVSAPPVSLACVLCCVWSSHKVPTVSRFRNLSDFWPPKPE